MAKKKASQVCSPAFNGIVTPELARMWEPAPTDVISIETWSSLYYRKRILRRLISLLTIENAPDTWDLNYMLEWLFLYGYIGVASFDEFGVLPLRCTLSGVNVYDRPTTAIFSNAKLTRTYEKIINQECVVLRLNYNFEGVGDMLNLYSQLLANCDGALSVNLMNSKVAYIFDCADKEQAETAKEVYDQISRGEPAVFIRANIPTPNGDSGVKFAINNVSNSYICDKVVDTKNAIWGMFYNDVGLDHSPVDKKERVNTEEVVSNNQQLINAIKDWKENLDDGIRRVNEMFGLNLVIRFPFYDEMMNAQLNSERAQNGNTQPTKSATDRSNSAR